MFSPCNIPLEQLIERKKENIERGKESRRAAMQRNAMRPHIAQLIARQEAAELLCLERLLALETANDSVHSGMQEDTGR